MPKLFLKCGAMAFLVFLPKVKGEYRCHRKVGGNGRKIG